MNLIYIQFPKVKEEIYLDCDSPSSSPRSYNAPSSPCSSRSMSPVGGNVYQTNGEYCFRSFSFKIKLFETFVFCSQFSKVSMFTKN